MFGILFLQDETAERAQTEREGTNLILKILNGN